MQMGQGVKNAQKRISNPGAAGSSPAEGIKKPNKNRKLARC